MSAWHAKLIMFEYQMVRSWIGSPMNGMSPCPAVLVSEGAAGADDKAGRHRADGVGRLARGPADHDEIAQDHAAQGYERDRDQEDLAIEVGDRLVAHRVERR